MTGQHVQPGRIREGRKWIVEDCDLVSSVRYYRDKRLRVGEWVSSLRGVEEGALFASDDLLPVAARIFHDFRKLLLPGCIRSHSAPRRAPVQADQTQSVPAAHEDLGPHPVTE